MKCSCRTGGKNVIVADGDSGQALLTACDAHYQMPSGEKSKECCCSTENPTASCLKEKSQTSLQVDDGIEQKEWTAWEIAAAIFGVKKVEK